jgi:stage V sporulation protein S
MEAKTDGEKAHGEIDGANNILTKPEANDIVRDDKERSEIPEDSIREGEVITCLKVKADPLDIAPEDRKRNVKKLAGAISHSLRAQGEINVRCFGSAAIGKAAKALAIARGYIKVQGGAKKLRLECSPAFITTKMGDTDLTGICFVTFASELSSETKEIDLSKCKSILKVSADDKDIDPELRKKNVKKLAGAIAHSLEENKEVVVRCFGNAAIGKAAKALAIARGYVAVTGGDLYCWPDFIVADMNGSERTGICFYSYTNLT